MGAFETRLATGYRGTCPTCMGLACDDCCHTGVGTTVVDQQQKWDTPERDVSQGCDRGGVMGISAGNRTMTPTEALRGRLDAILDDYITGPPADRATFRRNFWRRFDEALDEDGYRLVGPDDVTVTVERLAEALRKMPGGYMETWPAKPLATAILAALSADKEGQK